MGHDSFYDGESSSSVTHHTENSESNQDVTMRDTSNINLTSQPSAMNIDSEPQSHSEHRENSEEPQSPKQQEQHQNQEHSHHDEEIHQPTPRRRSTMILTDDPEFEKLKSKRQEYAELNPDINNEESISKLEDHNNSTDSQHNNNTIPFEIVWVQGGENVFITGSFTGWRKMIKLTKESNEKFSIKLKLPVGTHRFRFIVDNELRFSDYLPTATDQMGNFVNYIEIQQPDVQMAQGDEKSVDEQQKDDNLKHEQKIGEPGQDERKDSTLGLTNDDDDMGDGYSRFHEEECSKPSEKPYIKDIPAIFTDPSVMEQYYLTLDNNAQNNQNQSWLTPPQLPPHLESVILNNFSTTDKSNSSGALPIPNHVVLNHLATTSIKHNTLAVASVVRYKRKYATQVLYAPLTH